MAARCLGGTDKWACVASPLHMARVDFERRTAELKVNVLEGIVKR